MTLQHVEQDQVLGDSVDSVGPGVVLYVQAVGYGTVDVVYVLALGHVVPQLKQRVDIIVQLLGPIHLL